MDAVDPAVNAVVARDDAASRREAEVAEEMMMAGEPLGLLHGLPLGIKDLQTTGGLRSTFGSLIYKDNVPDEDDDTVANVRDEGAIIVGKTNTPEFGAGANTKNRVYGATGNPFDPDKTCGGSSGGAAVALACGMMPIATGSDYGGSLRTPAAFCGVVGFRPSAGLVPVSTRASLLTPFTVQGPMGRTVQDAYLLLRAQADLDIRDPFTSEQALALPEQLPAADLGAVHAAFSADLGCAPVDHGMRKLFEDRTALFSGVFAEAATTAPDFGDDVHEVFEILRGVYFVAAHRERLEKNRDLLGPNVIDNTERGLKYSLGDVAWAHAKQSEIYKRILEMFEEYDVVIAPTSSVSPFPHAELSVSEINGETMPTYMRWLALAYAPTTAMTCACALPCGLDEYGMPFGIQVIGPRGSDAQVLSIAMALEAELAGNDATKRPTPDIAKLKAAPRMARPSV